MVSIRILDLFVGGFNRLFINRTPSGTLEVSYWGLRENVDTTLFDVAVSCLSPAVAEIISLEGFPTMSDAICDGKTVADFPYGLTFEQKLTFAAATTDQQLYVLTDPLLGDLGEVWTFGHIRDELRKKRVAGWSLHVQRNGNLLYVHATPDKIDRAELGVGWEEMSTRHYRMPIAKRVESQP